MSSTETDRDCGADSALLGAQIDALWNDERCEWKLVYESSMGTENHGWWNVYLDWTSDSGNPHGCEWVTYTWQFYACSAETAMRDAVAWLEQLAPWRPCGECDGQGAWHGVSCVSCNQTGLAYGGRGGVDRMKCPRQIVCWTCEDQWFVDDPERCQVATHQQNFLDELPPHLVDTSYVDTEQVP